MSEIDVSKCKYYLKDGSCSSMNEECTRCIHNYCDWKVNKEQLQQLKAENEELKREKTKYQNRYQQLAGSYNRAMSYKQCLDEIEEKVKDLKNECFYDDFECADCDMTFACNYHKKYEILQKIKEVKGDE